MFVLAEHAAALFRKRGKKMNQRFEAFLAVTECGSMQKAAEKQCVSYQCISGHIRSLEEEYHTRLFERRPEFALTESGRILADSLQKIRLIEKGISEALDEQGRDVVGQVRLGVPASRYTELVPPLLSRFKKEYPNVELEIAGEFSDVLEQQVERGLLDMAVVVQQAGVGTKLERRTLLKESYSFLTSKDLLETVMEREAEEAVRRWLKGGISLREISRFPLVSVPAGSRLRAIMDNAAKNQGFSFTVVFSSNRLETFDAIVRTDLAGCLMPRQMTGITLRLNQRLREEKRLLLFPVDWKETLPDSDIALIRRREAIFAPYKEKLMQLIEEFFRPFQTVGEEA